MSRIQTPQDSTDDGKIVLRIKYIDSKGFCFVRNPVENQSDVSPISQRSLLKSHHFPPNSNSSKEDSDFSCKQGLGFLKNHQESIFYAEKESDKIDLDKNVEYSASRYVDEEAENITQSVIDLEDDLEPSVKLNQSIGAESWSLKEHNDLTRKFTYSHTIRNTDTICPHLTSRDVSWETALSCGLDDVLPMTHSPEGLPVTFQNGDSSGTDSVTKHSPHPKSEDVLKHCKGQPYASTKLCPKKEKSASKKRPRTVVFDAEKSMNLCPKKGKFFSVPTISDTEETACSKKEVIENTTNSPLHSFKRYTPHICVVSGLPHSQEPCQNFKGMDQSHVLIKSHMTEKSSADKKDSTLYSCSSSIEVMKPQHPRIDSSFNFYESASSQSSYKNVDCSVQKIFGQPKKKRGHDFSALERNQNLNHSQETVRERVHQKLLQKDLSEKGKRTQVKTSKSEILCKCGPTITQDNTSRKFCTNCSKRRFKFQSAAQQRLAKQTTEFLSKTVSTLVKDHTYCLPFQEIRESCYNQLQDLEVKEELPVLCIDVLKESVKSSLVFSLPNESHNVCWTLNNSCVESSLLNKQLENFSSAIEVCEKKDVDEVNKEITPNDQEIGKLQMNSVLQFVKLSYPFQFRLAKTSPVFPLKPCYVVIDRLLFTDSRDLRPSTLCSRYCREECLEFLCAYGTLNQCSKCVCSHNHEDSEEEDEEAWFSLKQKHSPVKKHNSLEGGKENRQMDLPEISEQEFSDSQPDYLKAFVPSSQCGERTTEISNGNSSTEMRRMSIYHANFESSDDKSYDTEDSQYELKEMKVVSHEISKDMPSKKEKVGPGGITKHAVSQTSFKQDFVNTELPAHCTISQRSDLKEAAIKKTLGNMFRVSKFNIKYYVFEAVGRAFFVPLIRGRAKSKLDEEDLAYVKRAILQMLNDKRTCARHLAYPECLKHRGAAEFDVSPEKLEKGNNSHSFSRSLSSLDAGTLETLINNGQLSKLMPRTSGQNLVEYLEQIGQCLNSCLMENGETATGWIKAMAKDIVAKQRRDKKSAKRLKPSKDVAIEIDIAHDGGDIDVGEENIWTNDSQQEFVVGVAEGCTNGTALPVLTREMSNTPDRFECAQFLQPESLRQSLLELRSGSFVCEEAYVQERKPLLGELISASMFVDGYPAGQQTDDALLSSCEGSQDAASELLQDPVTAMPLSREIFCASGISLDTSGRTVYADCNGMLIKSEISIESGEGHEHCGAPVSERVNNKFSPSVSVPLSHDYAGYQMGGLPGEHVKRDQQTILQSEESPNPALTYALIKQEPLDECFPLEWPSSPQEDFQMEGIHVPGTSEAALPCISSVTFGAAALEMANNAQCDHVSVNDLSSKAYLDDKVSLSDRELSKPEHLMDVGFQSHHSQLPRLLSQQDQCVIRTNSCLTHEGVSVEAINDHLLTEQHLVNQGYPKVCHAVVPLTLLDERIELVGEQADDLTSNMPRDERSCSRIVGNEANHVLATAVVKREQISSPADYTDIQGIHFYGHTSAFSCPHEEGIGEGGYVQIMPFPSEHSSPVETLGAFNDTYKSGIEVVHTAAFGGRWDDASCPEDLADIDEGSVGSSPWDQNSFHHDSCDDFVQDDSDGELRGAIQAAVSSALCEDARPVTRENAIGNAAQEMMAHQVWPASADHYVKHESFGNTSCVTGLADGVIEIGSLETGADHTTIKPFAMGWKELTPRVRRGSKRKARGRSTIRSKRRGTKATSPSSAMAPLSNCMKSNPSGLCMAPEVATSPELSPSLVPSSLGITNPQPTRLTQRVRSPAFDGIKRSRAKANVEHSPAVTSEIGRERRVGKRVAFPVRQRKCRSSGHQSRSQRNDVCCDLTDVPDIEIDKAVEENVEGSLLTEGNDACYTEAELTVCNQAEVSPKAKPKSRQTVSKQRKGIKRKLSEVKKASASNSDFSLESPRAAHVSTAIVQGFSKIARTAPCLEEPSETDVVAGGAPEWGGVGNSLKPTRGLASGTSTPSGNVADKKPVRDRERSFFDCLPKSFLDAWKS